MSSLNFPLTLPRHNLIGNKLNLRFLLYTLMVWLLCSNPFALLSQGYCEENCILLPEVHPVASMDVIYKTAVAIDEWDIPIPKALRLRVFYPADLQAGERRPLVVLVHGGGFVAGNYTDFAEQARQLAELGFVAATVGYRLCERTDCLIAAGLSFPCNVSWGSSLVPSAYVATVDVLDGIKWLKQHAFEIPLDPENIAVGGHSAGAWTALHTAFMDQDEVNAVCTGCGIWPDYVGVPLPVVSGIRAVFSLSGAILDTTWIDEDELDISVMLVHGTHDGVVLYGTEPVYPCCGTFQTPVLGSGTIAEYLDQQGAAYYLLTGNGFGHDILDPQWRPFIEEQLVGFLTQALVCEDGWTAQLHTEIVRDPPVVTCPSPFPPIIPAPGSTLPLSAPPGVIFTDGDPVAAFDMIIEDTVVTFMADTNGFTSWEWDFGDGTTAVGPIVRHVYAGNGEFTVTLVARNDCLVRETTLLIVDADEAAVGSAMASVAPQPFGSSFDLSLPWAAEATLYDASGRRYWREYYDAGKQTIDASQLHRGIYVLTLRYRGGIEMLRLVRM